LWVLLLTLSREGVHRNKSGGWANIREAQFLNFKLKAFKKSITLSPFHTKQNKTLFF